MRALQFLAAGAALASLAACQPAHNGMTGGSAMCIPFPATNASATGPAPTGLGTPAVAAPLTPADPGAAVDDCVHRWAYALAASGDDADHVAQASLAACGSALARWNQQAASADGGPPVEAPSLITGQPTTPIAEHLTFAQGRAVFYAVQARAGKCAAPPMKDGVPVGLARD